MKGHKGRRAQETAGLHSSQAGRRWFRDRGSAVSSVTQAPFCSPVCPAILIWLSPLGLVASWIQDGSNHFPISVLAELNHMTTSKSTAKAKATSLLSDMQGSQSPFPKGHFLLHSKCSFLHFIHLFPHFLHCDFGQNIRSSKTYLLS